MAVDSWSVLLCPPQAFVSGMRVVRTFNFIYFLFCFVLLILCSFSSHPLPHGAKMAAVPLLWMGRHPPPTEGAGFRLRP